MKLAGPPIRRRSRMSVTPLIDVVFILLFFFMLASSFDRWQTIELTLIGDSSASARSGPVQTLPVRAGVEVEWQGRWLDQQQLLDRLAVGDPNLGLVLKPLPGTPIQDLVQLLEVIRAETANPVSLAVAE